MFGLGGSELMIVAGIALLLLGPSQLPKLFRGLGASVRELRSAAKEVTGGSEEVPEEDRARRDRNAGGPERPREGDKRS